MKILKETFEKTGAIHHAYALEGEKTVVVPALFKFLEKDFGIVLKNNPDFSYQEFETFTIDDGRALQERHGRRALDGKKIFIISTRFITTEAQNALLKIFEEPSEGTHFFLVMPNTQILLPTLKSRLVVVNHNMLSDSGTRSDIEAGTISKIDSEMKSLVKKFLSGSLAERIVLVKPIVEEKDKGKAIDFVTALEQTLAPRLQNTNGKNVEKNESVELSENASVLTEILIVKKYLHDRAPSVKLLLEHLCLSVTITKS